VLDDGNRGSSVSSTVTRLGAGRPGFHFWHG